MGIVLEVFEPLPDVLERFGGKAYRGSVRWSDRDGGQYSVQSDYKATATEANAEAWRMADELGYRSPQWWEWWRWNERTR